MLAKAVVDASGVAGRFRCSAIIAFVAACTEFVAR